MGQGLRVSRGRLGDPPLLPSYPTPPAPIDLLDPDETRLSAPRTSLPPHIVSDIGVGQRGGEDRMGDHEPRPRRGDPPQWEGPGGEMPGKKRARSKLQQEPFIVHPCSRSGSRLFHVKRRPPFTLYRPRVIVRAGIDIARPSTVQGKYHESTSLRVCFT